MCASDLSPFSLVEKPGFRKAAQFFINVGCQYGNVDAEKLVPRKGTISKEIHETYESTMEKLRVEMAQVIFMLKYLLKGNYPVVEF